MSYQYLRNQLQFYDIPIIQSQILHSIFKCAYFKVSIPRNYLPLFMQMVGNFRSAIIEVIFGVFWDRPFVVIAQSNLILFNPQYISYFKSQSTNYFNLSLSILYQLNTQIISNLILIDSKSQYFKSILFQMQSKVFHLFSSGDLEFHG